MIAAGLEAVGEFFENCLADGIGVHGLREDLEGKNVVVAIDDESGEKIGFAEDQTVGVGVADDGLAIGDGVGDSLAKQRRKIGDRIRRRSCEWRFEKSSNREPFPWSCRDGR